MLSLEQIQQQYPEHLRAHTKSMLREYLQYIILNSIFESAAGRKMVLMGGTALRTVHGGNRFSEDLDFDNYNLTAKEFDQLGVLIRKDLDLLGLTAEVDLKTRTAFRLKIRIPQLLYDVGLSNLPEQKIMIQVDTEPQGYEYTPDKPIINKFGILTKIFSVPPNILLSQKIFAAVKRKRAKGRDFYDIVFLRSLGVKPDFGYTKLKLNIADMPSLKDYVLQKINNYDFKSLASEVEPFLFDPRQSKKVSLFREYVIQNF